MSLRAHSLLNVLLEVVLISIGVFLALLANNWHEDREHRVLAESTLRNFAKEIRTNEQALQKERKYHEDLARELHQFLLNNEPLTEERLRKAFTSKESARSHSSTPPGTWRWQLKLCLI